MNVFRGPYITCIAAGGANAATDETIIILPCFFLIISRTKSLVKEITEVPKTLIHFSSSSTEFFSKDSGRA